MVHNNFLKSLFSNKRILVLFIILIPLVSITVWLSFILGSKTFYEGIKLENIVLSGYSKSQAQYMVQEKLNHVISDNKLSLYYDDRAFDINLQDISYKFLTGEAIDNAYKIGHEGNIVDRIKSIFGTKLKSKNLKVHPIYSKDSLLKVLGHIKKEIDRKEKNAEIFYVNDEIQLEKEVIGLNVDIDKNLDLIENSLIERNFSPIELYVESIYPKVLSKQIEHIKDPVSDYSTTFSISKQNRSFNIKLACERINNKVIFPGEVFSMDNVLGKRTLQNGYKDAPVILNNKMVEGVGGGVCQVTTTLYVAVLKASLEVIERTHHSMPLGYVDPGQDATIAEGYIDFKFRNNKDKALLISAQVSGNKIIVKIIGQKDSEENIVKLRSVIQKVMKPGQTQVIVDATVPDGEVVVENKAVDGMKVVVYRETYDKSFKLVQKEMVSEDIYKSVTGKIRVSPNYYRDLVTSEEEYVFE